VNEVLLGQSATAVGRSNSVTGHITIQGSTVSAATFSVPERTATTIEVQGSIPVLFSNWGISNPSIGGFVTTQDHGLLEFLLVSRKG
jgi:hypothetical protein